MTRVAVPLLREPGHALQWLRIEQQQKPRDAVLERRRVVMEQATSDRPALVVFHPRELDLLNPQRDLEAKRSSGGLRPRSRMPLPIDEHHPIEMSCAGLLAVLVTTASGRTYREGHPVLILVDHSDGGPFVS